MSKLLRLWSVLLVVFLLVAAPGCGPGEPEEVPSETPAESDSPGESVAVDESVGWEALAESLARGEAGALDRLETLFHSAASPDQRLPAAWLLVLAHDDDAVYFDALSERAREAALSDMPYPFPLTDSATVAEALATGDFSKARPSPEFLEWCASRNAPPIGALSVAKAHQESIRWLGLTEDPRAMEILLRAVESANVAVATEAAHGLARVGDPRGIEPIRATAARLPAEMSEFFGFTLLYFDDPEAQRAGRELIGDETAVQNYVNVAAQDRQRRELLRRAAQGSSAGG